MSRRRRDSTAALWVGRQLKVVCDHEHREVLVAHLTVGGPMRADGTYDHDRIQVHDFNAPEDVAAGVYPAGTHALRNAWLEKGAGLRMTCPNSACAITFARSEPAAVQMVQEHLRHGVFKARLFDLAARVRKQ